MWSYIPLNELYHFGVPGMKWGVRRSLSTALSNHFSKVKKESNERLKKRGGSKGKSVAIELAKGLGRQIGISAAGLAVTLPAATALAATGHPRAAEVLAKIGSRSMQAASIASSYITGERVVSDILNKSRKK